MPTEMYGNVQVKELRFTQREIEKILHERIIAGDTPYDFDYYNPIILHDGSDTIFRFVQKQATVDIKPKDIHWRTIQEMLDKAKKGQL